MGHVSGTENPQALHSDPPKIPQCVISSSEALIHSPQALSIQMLPESPSPPTLQGPPAKRGSLGLKFVCPVCGQTYTLVLILRGKLGLSPRWTPASRPASSLHVQLSTARDSEKGLGGTHQHTHSHQEHVRDAHQGPHPEAWGRRSPSFAGNLSFSAFTVPVEFWARAGLVTERN